MSIKTKKNVYKKYSKRFKRLNKIKEKSSDLYFELLSLYNDCKEHNLSMNVHFIPLIIDSLKKINENCDVRLFNVFYSYDNNDDLFDVSKRDKFKKVSYEIKKFNEIESEFLTVEEVYYLFDLVKFDLQQIKYKIQEIYNKINEIEKNRKDDLFFWSRSLGKEDLFFYLLGSDIYCKKTELQWIIYKNENIIFDGKNTTLSLNDIENIIIEYFINNSIDYKKLLISELDEDKIDEIK